MIASSRTPFKIISELCRVKIHPKSLVVKRFRALANSGEALVVHRAVGGGCRLALQLVRRKAEWLDDLKQRLKAFEPSVASGLCRGYTLSVGPRFRFGDPSNMAGSAVIKSGYESHGSGRSADVWRAVTVRTLGSLSAAETERQEAIRQGAGTAKTFKCREDELVNLVLAVLGSLINPPSLPQFKADLLDIARDAISLWTSAQCDERTFTINSTLNQENKRHWNVAALDYDSLYADDRPQQVVESRPLTKVFTLFPIIIATKRVQAPKVATGAPGSGPEQDQRTLGTEVTLIHNGLGLPQESEMVQMGIKEVEDKERLRLELDELLVEKMAEKDIGHSRNNSTAVSASGPSSPIQRWSENRRNGHPTEI
ncbi:hypothetical protein V491_02030 [Pseudogymnoascus sp. VKM F-3775]|nr:hypothetical protein V491_02030 [Pseudogymnoascus sp. VKM F-3775]